MKGRCVWLVIQIWSAGQSHRPLTQPLAPLHTNSRGQIGQCVDVPQFLLYTLLNTGVTLSGSSFGGPQDPVPAFLWMMWTSWADVTCSWVWSRRDENQHLLPQVEAFKDLGVLFTDGGRMEWSGGLISGSMMHCGPVWWRVTWATKHFHLPVDLRSCSHLWPQRGGWCRVIAPPCQERNQLQALVRMSEPGASTVTCPGQQNISLWMNLVLTQCMKGGLYI